MLVLALPALAEDIDDNTPNGQSLRVIDRGTVKQVLKSDMIMLDDDKRYRLENILVPPFEEAPAIDELKHEFLSKPVAVYAYHAVEDDQEKSGVVPYAHVVTTKGVWVQQDLISKGLAWAQCTETSPQTVGVLKQSEEKARVDRLGFWRDPAYAIKSPDNVKDFIDSYQIVEGKITSVLVSSNTGFVGFNFGKEKKRVFAIRFTNDNQFQAFWNDPVTSERSEAGLNLWKGRTVRVRGWVKDGGDGVPVMVLTRKEQLDVVTPPGEQ